MLRAKMDGEISTVHDAVVEYYTSHCGFGAFEVFDVSCLKDVTYPAHMVKLTENVHEDVVKRFLGCGYPNVSALESLSVLDLGCGHGRDVFIYSQMVGPDGHVTGVDITPSSVAFMESKIEYHTKKYGYTEGNVQGICTSADNLSAIQDSSIDLVVSNGLTCLLPNKNAVIKEIYRVLKDGGEFCNLDCYCSGEQPDELKKDPVIWAEGCSGSFYWKNFVDLCHSVGFLTPLVVSMHLINYKDDYIREKLPKEEHFQQYKQLRWGNVNYRVFKVDPSLSSPALVTYKGGIKDHEEEYLLDVNTTFKKGTAFKVASEVAAILQQTRLAKYFDFSPVSEDLEKQNLLVNPFEWVDLNCP